ncbi:MAG: hypothetical protein JW785_07175 [Acidimicrobiia bacterium]|nr:hypothetical protein [Acidimicrobiia bacterium]
MTNRRTDPTPPIAWPRTDDSGDSPLSGEDLIGDLDPGWLDWRDHQSGR